MFLPVVYEHGPMCVRNVVWDEDVGMSMIALVWAKWMFELSSVSG